MLYSDNRLKGKTMSQIEKDFEHLSNGDVSNILKNHRVVQVHQAGQRYAGVRLPMGDKLVELACLRLVSAPAPQVVEAPAIAEAVLTAEEATGAFTVINTIDDLTGAFVQGVLRHAPGVTEEYLAEAADQMKGRAIDAILATVQPDPALVLEATAEDLVRDFDSILSLEELHTYLARGKEDEVGESLTALLGRIKVLAQPAPVAETPVVEKVTEVPADAPAPEAEAKPATGGKTRNK